VGGGGLILRWNGTALTSEASDTTNDLRGVAVVDPYIAWAVGVNGTVVRWNGSRWSSQSSGTMQHLQAVHAEGNQMIAVGMKGAAVAFDSSWHVVMTDSPDDLHAIAGDLMHGLFAVGTLGTVAKYDGMAFHRVAVPGYTGVLAGATVDGGGAWIVGLDGAVFHYADFQPLMGLPSVFLRGVAAPGADRLIVVGFDGLVAERQGSAWVVHGDVPAVWYEAVWSAPTGDAWVVGNASTILRLHPLGAPLDGGMGDGAARDGGGK
jgi:hypothetical protein